MGNWEKIGTVLIVLVFIGLLIRRRDAIKQMMEYSRSSPQYWGVFAFLMLGVFLLVYVLIKL